MAQGCERVQRVPFLYTGAVPQLGMGLYLQLNYEHDGSHPEAFRGWARMTRRITHVFEPPEVGWGGVNTAVALQRFFWSSARCIVNTSSGTQLLHTPLL